MECSDWASLLGRPRELQGDGSQNTPPPANLSVWHFIWSPKPALEHWSVLRYYYYSALTAHFISERAGRPQPDHKAGAAGGDAASRGQVAFDPVSSVPCDLLISYVSLRQIPAASLLINGGRGDGRLGEGAGWRKDTREALGCPRPQKRT